MPHSTMGGDDPDHQLTKAQKDEEERRLRIKARELLKLGKAKERRELENRAVNISRRESRKADHHYLGGFMSAPSMKELIAEYRELVTSEATISAFQRSIFLVEQIAGLTIALPEIENAVAELEHDESVEEQHHRNLSESLKTYMRDSFDEARLRRRTKRALLTAQECIWRAAVALSVPKFISTQATELSAARQSLLLDAALVVFHQAYFGLVPIIPSTLRKERDLLFNSFLEFSNSLYSVADRERIRALVHEINGDHILASFHFRHAIAATSPKEHEFITLLQMAWSHAIEHKRYVEASGLLLENASRVRAEDYEELKSMLLDTLDCRRAA